MERDGLTEEAAERRMAAQLTNAEYVHHANVIFSSQWRSEYTLKQVSAQVRGQCWTIPSHTLKSHNWTDSKESLDIV